MMPDNCEESLQRDKSNKDIKSTATFQKDNILHILHVSAQDTATYDSTAIGLGMQTILIVIVEMAASRTSSTTF